MSTTKTFIDDSYDLMIDLMKRAGALALEGYNSEDQSISTKLADWDVVTHYDKAIENLFIDEIRLKFSDHKFLAEETSGGALLSNDPTWIIDPIDGTTNYVHKIPLFAINVAFAVNKELKFGATFIPKLDELYTARKGQGAFLNGNRIHCSNTSNLAKATIGYESLFQFNDPVPNKIAKRYRSLVKTARAFNAIGSAAVLLCYVARGYLDGCILHDLFPYDIAAGAILVTEAGGKVTLDDGRPFDVIEGCIVAGCNDHLNLELNRMISKADQEPLHIA